MLHLAESAVEIPGQAFEILGSSPAPCMQMHPRRHGSQYFERTKQFCFRRFSPVLPLEQHDMASRQAWKSHDLDEFAILGRNRHWRCDGAVLAQGLDPGELRANGALRMIAFAMDPQRPFPAPGIDAV